MAENFRRFCGAVGTDADALVKNHQVHGDLVRPVTRADVLPSPGAPGTVEADGLITRTPGLCLTVFSSDCIPVLLCDPRKKVAAAVHAGWRGTALGIAARAAEAMIRNFGCRPGDLMAAIGPGISLCCFETHGDVPAGLRAGLGGAAEAFIHPVPGTNTMWTWRAPTAGGCSRPACLPTVSRSVRTAPPATAPLSGPTAGWAPTGAAWPL